MTLPAPAVSALPTLDQVAAILRDGGYTITALDSCVVVASRPIPGSPHDSREIVCYRAAEDIPWHGSCHHRHLVEFIESAEGYSIPNYRTHVLHQSGWLETLDDLGLWVGGVSSIATSHAETDAIRDGIPPTASAKLLTPAPA